jgi:hypothetical protein
VPYILHLTDSCPFFELIYFYAWFNLAGSVLHIDSRFLSTTVELSCEKEGDEKERKTRE